MNKRSRGVSLVWGTLAAVILLLVLRVSVASAGWQDQDYDSYLDNSSFANDLSYWTAGTPSSFGQTASCPDGHVGCLVMKRNPPSGNFWIEQDFYIDVTGTVQFQGAYHFTPALFGAGAINTHLLDPDGNVIIALTCDITYGCSSNWVTLSSSAAISVPGVFTLRISGNWDGCSSFSCPSQDSYVDNLHLTVNGHGPRPLLDRMLWGAEPECPVCSAQGAVGWAGGPINTRSGNLSYQTTDLAMPIAGGELAFRRSYASQATGVYTATMGHGWTHNYEMRLHVTDTALTDTVELQAPGGSRLPFFDNGDGTYSPYPGVTAQLAEVGATYVVTAFNQMVYTFDANRLLLAQEDADGNGVTFSYSGGKLTQAAQGARSLTYAYDATTGYLTSVTDSLGRSVQLGYNGGNLVTVTDTLDLATSYYYSATASPYLLTEVIDPSGVTVEKTAYDAEGRATRQWDGADNLLVDIDFTIANTHVITENGVVMTHTYDSRGTLVESTFSCADGTAGCGSGADKAYDGNFKAGQVADANGNATDLVWDAGGSNLEQVTDALTHTTSMAYDALNNLTQVVDSRGLTTTYHYANPSFPTFRTGLTDALGNTTVYTPTLPPTDTVAGFLKAERDPNGKVTTYDYNPFGQVITVVQAAGTADAVITTYGYDAVGRLITTTETAPGESHTTWNIYDDGDRLLATVANGTGTITNTQGFGDCGSLPARRDDDICTLYGYDEAGRIISTTNALGQRDLTYYDSAGRVITAVVNYSGTLPYGSAYQVCDHGNPDPEYNLCSLTGYDQFGRVVTTTNVLGQDTVNEYNSLGRLERTIVNYVDGVYDADYPDEDIETGYAYDAAGNTIVVTDTLGRATRTFYDALNRVAGTVDNWSGTITQTADLPQCLSLPEARDDDICTLYEYDEVGNTIIVTDTLGRMTRTFYDGANRIEATVENWQPGFTTAGCFSDPYRDENVCTLYGHDGAGNQVTVTNALAQTGLTVYDAANRPVVQVQNWDGVTEILAGGTGCADTATNPHASENLCSFTAYDALGRRAAITDTLGNGTAFAYDGLGRVVTTTRTLAGVPVETTTTYDALGSRLAESDANEHTTHFAYDALNRLVTTTSPEGVVVTQTYNAAGWTLSTSDGVGNTTTNSYDDLGRLISTTDPENNTTQYAYDGAGNQIAQTDAEGVRTVYLYDAADRLRGVIENSQATAVVTQTTGCTFSAGDPGDQDLCTLYRYDVLGNRTVITNARGYTVTETAYDGLNRPVTVADALGNATTFSYDLLGNRTVITDANGEVTRHAYDDLNRLITTTYQSDGITVTYQYDAAGNRTQMVDSVGTTGYVYDDFYRLITVTHPITGSIGYGYDNAGNRTRLTYPDDRQVTYDYDGDNRLITVTSWLTGTTTYGYDPAGRLVTTTLPSGVVSVNGYDDAGRLLTIAQTTAGGEWLASYQYTLDGVGNRLSAQEVLAAPCSAGSALTITLTGDDVGLSWPEAAGNTAGYAIHRSTSPYFAAGDTTSVDTVPPGTAVYTDTGAAGSSAPNYYYAVGFLHCGAATTPEVGKFSFTLVPGDGSGGSSPPPLLSLPAASAQKSVPTGSANLVSASAPTGTHLVTTTITYTYDALYRVTAVTYTGGISATYGYLYDRVGNMLAYTETVGVEQTSVSRSFDAANRLQTASDAAAGTTSYYYDDNGNLEEILPPGATGGNPVGALRYGYEQRNLLITHTNYVSGTGWVEQAAYVYDGSGDRLRQVDYTEASPITTTYTNDVVGLTQVLVADDGAAWVHNLFGLDLISQDNGDEVRILLADGLGSVRLEMVGEAVASATTYGPYGEVLVRHGTGDSAYGFAGEHTDSATGLLYLRARYYSPALKRFQSRDQWEGSGWRPETLNYYVYVHGNPANHTDPTGHYVCRSPSDCDPPGGQELVNTDPRNLTPWIVAEANYLPTLPEGERIALGLEPAPYSPSTTCLVCSWHSFYEIVKDGAPLDVKDRIQEELGDVVQLGGVWFEYSTPGNILYGYYGSAWGFAPAELHAGAGVAQLLDYCRDREVTPLGPPVLLFDTADDYYAVEFGIELYYEGYATDRVVTESEFTSLLTTYQNLSKMSLRVAPPSDVYNPNWPYWQGYFYNDLNVPQSELLFPSFQELR